MGGGDTFASGGGSGGPNSDEGTESLVLYVFLFFLFLGGFFIFFSYCIQHGFICHPSDTTVPTDAGIEPRTVATGALTVRCSNH